ncbi:MAG TPA: AraC family transcriptional regulator [Polyangia bacterium]|jgi:AraC-like DNA-binding protein
MTDRPESLLKRPEPTQPSPLRDPLSDVLKTVRLRGAVFFALESSAPWANGMPDGETLAPVLVPRAQQIISFHVFTHGACWGGLLDGPQVRMEAGDVVVFPRGDGYFMSFVRQQQPPPPNVDQAFAFMRGMTGGQLPFSVKFGGGGSEQVGAICGFLGCDARPFNPLIATLPRMLHIKGAARAPDDRLARLMELTLTEARDQIPGAESVRLRLSELMFVEVIRRHVAALPAEQAGWLAGLRDELVGRALGLLHERAAHPWTLDQLASDVGMSRSAFADRFARLVGEPPMQYLTRWRMQMAARLLSDGSAKVAAIAVEVGYDSEAAFSRAFKKVAGMSPAAWRQQRLR